MTTLIKLRKRAKEQRIRRFSVMKKDELLKMTEKAEKDNIYYKTIHCDQCVREQRKQKIIDEHTYNRKIMANVILRLVCRYCKHEDFVVDGELQICMDCGVIKE